MEEKTNSLHLQTLLRGRWQSLSEKSPKWRVQHGKWVKDRTKFISTAAGLTPVPASTEEEWEGVEEQPRQDHGDSKSDFNSQTYVKKIVRNFERRDIGETQDQASAIKLDEEPNKAQDSRDSAAPSSKSTYVKETALNLFKGLCLTPKQSRGEGLDNSSLASQGTTALESTPFEQPSQRSVTHDQRKVRLLGKTLWQPPSQSNLAESSVSQVQPLAQELKPNPRQQGNSRRDNGGAKSMPQLKDTDLTAQLLHKLGLDYFGDSKLTTSHFLEISESTIQNKKPSTERELVHVFMQHLMTANYTARQINVKNEQPRPKAQRQFADNDINALFENSATRTGKQAQVHPMDLQMALFLCADDFLRQVMMNKLSECQYAVPLMVPNPFTKELEIPLWAMHQIKKCRRLTDSSDNNTYKVLSVSKALTPMVAFLRLGPVVSSKSQLMNSLINDRHNTFFHRQCPGGSSNQLLMDGLVEIAWYCPSEQSTDHFPDCVAFCNLHGDSSRNTTQRCILTQMSSVNVVLLSSLEDKERESITDLWHSETPLIVILNDDDLYEDDIHEIINGKYKVRLSSRNQADVSVKLKEIIRKCLSIRPAKFSLENLTSFPGVSLDEHNKSCQRGKEAAQTIMRLLQKQNPFTFKDLYLPCQGELWHDWCWKVKELRRFPNKSEAELSKKLDEIKELRRKQQEHGFSDLMSLFVGKLHSLSECERKYFIKWIAILLDDFTSANLCPVRQEYDKQWNVILALKNEYHDQRNLGQKNDQIKCEEANLEKISKKRIAATLGLEHILREMGQIYEAYISENLSVKRKFFEDPSQLPVYAAQLMISGHPMELMDGDTAYVPLTWVSAVLQEVIEKLGDQKVFVLSVLGLQSSGKSTMLNAMFGLQFAVSAGRCTKGAFMQMVKVSDDLKEKLKFDYILVIDTEGLRAPELAGTSNLRHDNELSTFVVGLGHLTLINNFGENLFEMQEILQIVVHAFLRMKSVQLSPSCMFVHQSISDIAAREKNMDGRMHLEGTLNRMAKLAANEEVCYVERFTDIIKFDVEKDVKYFAPLWEGSPPMAPTNPRYSENILDLKQDILSHASSTSGLRLSQFQQRVKDLWEALLKENFVFSFRNAQEISVYRKLEKEYGIWSWNLRSAMLGIEDKMLNRVASGVVKTVQRQDLINEMAPTLDDVQKAFNLYFKEDSEKEILINWKGKFETQIQNLHDDLIDEAKQKVDVSIQQKIPNRNLDRQRKDYEKKLFEKSKELVLKLKKNVDGINHANRGFDFMWTSWVSELPEQASTIPNVDVLKDITDVIFETYNYTLALNQSCSSEWNAIGVEVNYNKYVLKRKGLLSFFNNGLKPGDTKLIHNLVAKAMEQTNRTVESFPFSTQGYNSNYIRGIARDVQTLVQELETRFKRKRKMPEDACFFKPEFYVNVTVCVCTKVKNRILDLHRKFEEANHPRRYFEKKKPEYFNIFHKYYAGATSAAILGEQVCNSLKEPILQSVYNMTALFVCGQMRGKVPFNGNRADLEKYLLKSLAEQIGDKDERFQNYLVYLCQPKFHFETFIRRKVQEFMAADNPQATSTIKGWIDHKEKLILGATKTATSKVKLVNGDTNVWLESFSKALADDLGDIRSFHFNEEAKDSTDFDILEEVLKTEFATVAEEIRTNLSRLSNFKMENFRERPDEILIKHFCTCCWEQCPFCGAVCTNSQRNHPGDHNADFHRTSGLNGMHYKDSDEFFFNFCTVAVASDDSFCPSHDYDLTCPFKDYRKAGENYAEWRISTDFAELVYWKWFLCEYQEHLEKWYKKKFCGRGKIPDEWKHYKQRHAIASLGLH